LGCNTGPGHRAGRSAGLRRSRRHFHRYGLAPNVHFSWHSLKSKQFLEYSMRTIFVLFDSLMRTAVGCYGSTTVQTPNFDRFARRAVTFDTHFVGSLPCMPARRDLHTGRLNFMHRSWGPLEPFDNSFPEMMEEEEDFCLPRCFASGFEFLDLNREADDWFLMLECFDPHEPFHAPARFKKAYETGWTGGVLDWPMYEKATDSPEEIAEIRA